MLYGQLDCGRVMKCVYLGLSASARQIGPCQRGNVGCVLMQLSRKNVNGCCDDASAPRSMQEKGVTSFFSYIRIVLRYVENSQKTNNLTHQRPH